MHESGINHNNELIKKYFEEQSPLTEGKKLMAKVMNKIKLYELLIPQNVEKVVFIPYYDSNKNTCLKHIDFDEDVLFFNRFSEKFFRPQDTNGKFYESPIVVDKELSYLASTYNFDGVLTHDIYYCQDYLFNINDNPKDLQEYINFTLENIKWPMYPDVLTIANRAHPTRQNIRQVAWFKAQTDRQVHWLD